jgi:hypothetical protein
MLFFFLRSADISKPGIAVEPNPSDEICRLPEEML